MKNILIPTDFSENSRNAIQYALDYFKNSAVTFYMLHVNAAVPSAHVAVAAEVHEKASSEIKMPLDIHEFVAQYQKLNSHGHHHFVPLEEDTSLVEAIRRHIKNKNIDLIVMGTRGNTGLKKEEMRSNTYEIISKVKSAIMVVPERAKFNDAQSISFVTDYHAIFRNKVLSALQDLLQMHKSTLKVLNLRPKNQKLTASQIDNKGFLHYFFREQEHSFHLLHTEELNPGLQEYVDSQQVRIIAIAARNLNFIQKLMLRRNNNGFYANVPFLVLHE